MEKGNKVRIKIKRFNPQVDEKSFYREYAVSLTEEKMSLLQALETIYRDQDKTLAFRRYCCGVQFCNSCLMQVDGKPAHACLTILSPGQEILVEPLARRDVLRDLIVEGN